MHINIYLISFVVILGVLLGINDSIKRRRLYIILCSIVLIFVAAMRSPEWMTFTYRIDTLNYKGYFESSFNMSWKEFWQFALARYVGFSDDFDIGFIALEKLIGYITTDFHIYSLLADLLFFVPFGLILYRYCTSMKQIVFAFVFYIALVQVYFFGGARQIFAMGFDMMALLSIIDKKKLLAVLFFLIGVSIHFSSFLFLVPLLMIWFGITPRAMKILHFICFILFPLVLLIPDEIIVIMGNVSGLEKYTNYGEGAISGGATTFIVLIELLSLFCLFAIKEKSIRENETMRVFYVMAPLFTLFAPLIRADGTMTRIALYYYLFLALLVPYGLECMFKGSTKYIIYIVVIGLLAFLTVSGGGMTYYFYWQI